MTKLEEDYIREHGEIIAALSANFRNMEGSISGLCGKIDGFLSRCDSRHGVVDTSFSDVHGRISKARDDFQREIAAISTKLSVIETGIETLRGDIKVLNLKASLWGGLAGCVPVVIYGVVQLIKYLKG